MTKQESDWGGLQSNDYPESLNVSVSHEEKKQENKKDYVWVEFIFQMESK